MGLSMIGGIDDGIDGLFGGEEGEGGGDNGCLY